MLRLISLSDYFMRELENPTKRLPTMVDIDRALLSCLQNGTVVRSHWALILLLLFFDLKTWSRAFQTVTPSFWTSAFTVDNEIYTSVSLKGEFFSGFHSTARVHNWTSAIFHFESFPPRNSKWSCISVIQLLGCLALFVVFSLFLVFSRFFVFFLFFPFFLVCADVHCRESRTILDFKSLVPIFFHNPFRMHRHTIFYLRIWWYY